MNQENRTLLHDVILPNFCKQTHIRVSAKQEAILNIITLVSDLHAVRKGVSKSVSIDGWCEGPWADNFLRILTDVWKCIMVQSFALERFI